MRSKVERPLPVPARFRRYKREDWPGGWFEYVTEREAWNAAQERVLIAGVHHDGRAFAYQCGPLGDLTTLLRDRREARMLDLGGVDSAVAAPEADSTEPEPG